jgi:DNA-binding transcriptional LysR family regulator
VVDTAGRTEEVAAVMAEAVSPEQDRRSGQLSPIVRAWLKMKTRTPSWDDLRILLAVHRDKSFLAAGKALGVAPSTVARRIEALERTLGRSIVHRANDGTRLDADALRLVALAEVSGTVRVSLSEGFVRPLMPALARLHAKHAALEVELIAESRMADIVRGEADIGIRIVRATSPSVVSKFLGRANTGLFASRDYLDRRLPHAKLPCQGAGLQDWVGFDRSLARLPQQARTPMDIRGTTSAAWLRSQLCMSRSTTVGMPAAVKISAASASSTVVPERTCG